MTPIGRSLRTTLAVVTATALTVTSALTAAAVGPGTALDANDLAPGKIVADLVVGDFTLKATAAKAVDVDRSDRTSDRGDVYAQRIKLNGTGDATQRSLAFTADGPGEVILHARSGSGTADRALSLYDASWTVVDTAPALADDASRTISTETLDIPAAGTYWIASPSSGVNLYHAEVSDGTAPERAPWADVAAPVVDAVEVDPADASSLLVRYTGLLGDDGADVAHAVLTDSSGTEVDRAFTAVDGATGTIALSPPSSGSYTVQVELTRSGEATGHTSAPVTAPPFFLPLAAPAVTGALTTAVAGGKATVTVEWGAVPEAESYSVQTSQGEGFTTAVTGVTGTTAEIAGFTPGATYQVRVVAHRGAEAVPGEPFEVVVAGAVERWQSADVGSNAGSGGSIVENADGTITFDARASSTKLSTSEDGFQYYYTEIDPTTENFTLQATFTVDDAATKDNQSGFGVIAVDTLTTGVSAARYMNSAGALVTRYGEGTGAVKDGTPGARFVHGYTGAPTDNAAGARDQSDSVAFDPQWRSDVTTGPRFATGDVFTLSLRKSNTGYHAAWLRSAADGGDVEVIQYDPDMLLKQDGERLYVGMAVARKIKVTVSDWELTTIHPADDEAAQEPPTVPVEATLAVDITSTTPQHTLDVPFVANMHGTGQILDADGDVVTDGIDLAPGERVLVPVALVDGVNELTARLVPDAEQPHLGEREEIASLDPVDVPLDVTVKSYGEPGQSIRVAPDGTPDGTGTSADPLDLHTAVDFAQPGQQIVLDGGTYAPTRKVVVERGRDGTQDAPITLMSEPGSRATLDFAGADGGLVLRGDWWHVYDLEVTRSTNKAVLVEGNHNVVEKVEAHHNADTGVQISGRSAEPSSMWPTDNLIVSTESHNNVDPGGNDADGFGVKLTVGEGNVLRRTIAHHNIDDGWDLFAKSITGPIGTVLVEDSVAYDNGWVEADPTRTGEGNGFKLGGESMPGDHLLRNSLSYGNLATGVTSNSGPDVRLEAVTSVGNSRGVRLETNAAATAYEATGVVSWQNDATDLLGLKQADTSLVTDPSNHWNLGAGTTVDASWFVSTDESVKPTITADGSIDMHGLYELTDAAPADAGARFVPVTDPTVIDLLPEVSDGEPGPAAWYATAVYLRGDVVQHDGIVYEARWWTRNQEPGTSSFGPWAEIGPADGAPAVAECAPAWEPRKVYTGGEVVSHDGVNHRALWWTVRQEPGVVVWGAWSAVGACA